MTETEPRVRDRPSVPVSSVVEEALQTSHGAGDRQVGAERGGRANAAGGGHLPVHTLRGPA